MPTTNTTADTADTADIIALHANNVLLITRGDDPFRGSLALPGGYRDPRETSVEAAVREVEEETGLRIHTDQLHFVATYAEPGRDPRGPVVSDAYLVILDRPARVQAGDDAATADWVPVNEALSKSMAFDHKQILRDGLTLSAHLGYSAAPRRQSR